MRIDKFLKVSRIIKRRTLANEACDAGRVLLNDREAKAGMSVKEGDIIEIRFGNTTTIIRVELVQENIRKEDTVKMYTVLK